MVTNILTAIIAVYLYLVIALCVIACTWGLYLVTTWLLKKEPTKEAKV